MSEMHTEGRPTAFDAFIHEWPGPLTAREERQAWKLWQSLDLERRGAVVLERLDYGFAWSKHGNRAKVRRIGEFLEEVARETRGWRGRQRV